MAKPLVIVESPAKAKTIAGYLGRDYVVESSIGHIRDLPRNASDVPAAFKGEPWARLGVDVDNDFKALYVVSQERHEQVAKLKRAAHATRASSTSRQTRTAKGESIAWHLVEVLSPRVPVHRMVFHEITPAAIAAAIANPGELDRRLVDAQEARRILDRLYGYEVSPCCGRRWRPACQQAASRAWPLASSSSASGAHGLPLRLVVGHRRLVRSRRARVRTRDLVDVGGRRGRRRRRFRSRRAPLPDSARSCCSTSRPPPARRALDGRTSRSPRWKTGPTGARRRRRS